MLASMSTLTLRLEAYDKAAKAAIAAAQTLADERKNPEVEPLHLLYTLLDRDETSRAAVQKAGVDPTDVMVEAELMIRKLAAIEEVTAFLSPRLLELLGRAEGEAARKGGVPVNCPDLMLACAQELSGSVKKVFRATGLSAPILRATLDGIVAKGGASSAPGQPASAPKGKGDPLEEFGRDLTRQAAHGGFDPTVGRDAELRRVLQVLARRRENNPLLVGEPGIGKTAIVNAFAGRLARGDVPRFLEGHRVVQLEMGALVAGATLRGQLEERLRALLAALRDSGGEVILFLSDLPGLVGRGGAGALLANALSRGEVHAIAVATPDELRKVMDEEPLLARRFVTIPVDPPTLDEALAVLRGVVGRFEIDHGVRIGDPALNAAVHFGRRYVPGVQLPKSAIDLIDEAAARVRVEMQSVPAELDAMERRVEALQIQEKSLEDDHDEASERSRAKLMEQAEQLAPKIAAMRARWEAELGSAGEVGRLKSDLVAAERELEQVRTTDDHARAGELRFGTIPLLEKQLAEAEEKFGVSAETESRETMVHDTVMPEDVADVVAAWTGVPVAKMLEEETQKLLRMEDSLRERVIGQDAAVTALSKAVRRGRVGLRDPRRPIGSFLFLGPTGVGKTELAKTLAEFLFDDEASLTRIDMSEFMEKHSVARLLGSPPGYVDSDQGGFLTEAVRQRPYSVVLFDELEKAHPDVFNILLQVLDDGRLTDSRGRLARFQDTVVLMTSNVGSELILDHEGTNEELKAKMQAALHDHFRPEFLNRIDDVVIFDPLGKEDLKGIAGIQLRALSKLLSHRRVGLKLTDAAVDHIVDMGYQPAFGARPLKRVILRELQDPMAEALLRGGYAAGDTVRVDVEDGHLTFAKG